MKFSKKNQRILDEIAQDQHVKGLQSTMTRARSVTVGTAFGGAVELTLRGNGNDILYSILQPTEVIELVHQLAGSVGCHIHIKPREDFSSWRMWKDSNDSTSQLAYEKPATLEHLLKAVQAITGNSNITQLQFDAPKTQLAETSILPEATDAEKEHFKRPPHGDQGPNWPPFTECEEHEFMRMGMVKKGPIQPGIIPDQMPLDQVIKQAEEEKK